jgi:hypothetical protein
VCVCVCVRERERERERKMNIIKTILKVILDIQIKNKANKNE